MPPVRVPNPFVGPPALRRTAKYRRYPTTFSPTGYASVVLADRPLIYWRQGEPSGTTAEDWSDHGNVGIYTGSPTLAQAALILDSDASALYDVTGNQYAISAAGPFNLNLVTVEVWFEYDGLQPGGSLPGLIAGFAEGFNGSTYDKDLIINPGGFVTFYIYDGLGTGPTYSASPNALTAGVHHIVGVYDGTNVLLYIDGQQAASIAAGSTFTSYTVPNVFVAGQTTGFPGMSGRRDEFAVYDYALSPAQIALHYTIGSGVSLSGITYTKSGLLIVGGAALSGADEFDSTETGAIISALAPSGADVFSPTETGMIKVDNAKASGADVFTASETGAIVSAAAAAGHRESVFNRLGSIISAFAASAADVFTASETGVIVSPAVAAGADVFTASETGMVKVDNAKLSGADVFAASETGMVKVDDSKLSGADAFMPTETGLVKVDNSKLSGADVFTASESGAVISDADLSGTSNNAKQKAGAIISAFALAGADAFTAAETGAVISRVTVAGADVFVATESGRLVAELVASGLARLVPIEIGGIVVLVTEPVAAALLELTATANISVSADPTADLTMTVETTD